MLGLFHDVDQPTPEIFEPVPALLGPLIAANTAGVSVENTTAKMRVTEVTFLNFSRSEIFIKKGNKKICHSLFSSFLKYYNEHILDYL